MKDTEFHITNFGSAGGCLSAYANQNGYVPMSTNANPSEWSYSDAETDRPIDEWPEFVAAAITATEKAQDYLDEWRANDRE